jgi:predicted MFS family arabinose efflux permease
MPAAVPQTSSVAPVPPVEDAPLPALRGEAATRSSGTLVRALFVFFAVAYLAQGIGQKAGVVSQPVTFYFKESLGMNAADIPKALAILVIPWTIKPAYGVLSDLFPLAGYRRRSYLVIVSALAAAAFLALAFATGATAVVAALFVASLGVAFGDVLVDALMVENGKRTGFTRQFQGVQWAWFYGALGAAALIGGQLCQRLSPAAALHAAALLPIPLLGLLVWTGLRYAPEEKATLSRAEVLTNLRGLGQALRSRRLWLTAAALALIGFEPTLGTPFYFYTSDVLKISQGVIGAGTAVAGVGAIAGAVLFNRLLAPRLSTRSLFAASVALGTVGSLGYLLVRDATSLLVLSFVGGVFGVMGYLTILSLAAEACPKRAEAFTFAGLMGVMNLANQGGAMIGGEIFERLGKQFPPLVLISAATTLLGLVALPLASPLPPAPAAEEEE